MRIGICCFPSYGGSGVVASELALALAEEGADVHVVSSDRPPRLDERPGVRFHRVDGSEIEEHGLFDRPLHTLALANRLAEVAAAARLDVIHAHYAAPHAVAALLARRMLADGAGAGPPCPVVTTVHGTDVSLVGARPSYREVVGWALRSSDRVTAPSEALAREAADRFSLDEPVEVIPNFVPPAAGGRPARPGAGSTPRKPLRLPAWRSSMSRTSARSSARRTSSRRSRWCAGNCRRGCAWWGTDPTVRPPSAGAGNSGSPST